MSKQDKLAGLLNKSGWLTKRWAQGQDTDTERKECNKEIAGLIFPDEEEEEEEPEDWKPNFPDRKEVLAMPVYDEYRIHYMCLAGWMYRYIDKYPNMVRQQIYELARRTRMKGAKYMRSFLINGSRAKSEKYISDALPWRTLDGKIDFLIPNEKCWKIFKIIEEACKYWGIHHKPTYRMARYNRDIFRAENNAQEIEGEWSDGSARITINFMRHFMSMQKYTRNNPNYKPSFEFINEPDCRNNKEKLGMMADYHLELWRGVEDLTHISKAMTCSGMCEGAHLNLIEKGHYFGRDFGSDEFKGRKITIEQHGISTKQRLMESGFETSHGLGSGWSKLAYNEDGSDDGSYSPIPWTPFKQADSDELYEMVKYGHTRCNVKRKKLIFTAFCMDVLRKDTDGIAKEEFDVKQMDSMNWDRLGQYKRVRQEL